MKIKDKLENELTLKEFFARWKKGINEITAIQQINATQWGYVILLIGIIWGIIYGFVNKMYFLAAIMTGAFIINVFGFIGVIQKGNFLKQMEETAKKMQEAPKPEYIA